MGSLWVVLGGARLALAQDAPPLEAPATDSTRPSVSAPKTGQKPPASARSGFGPLLVIPGVTAPTPRDVTLTKPKTAQSSGRANPTERDSAPRKPTNARVESVPDPTYRSKIPLTLEPIDDDPAVDQRAPLPPTARGRPLDWPPGVPFANERPPGTSLSDAAAPRSAPPRGLGLFGRFLGPASLNPPRPESRNPQSKTRVNADPQPDPTTDAANKRKIESEIRDSLGDRLRSVEVRVSGRNVLIVAKPSRFWQKRTVRRSLETLPGLTGFRARVDVLD
jgi:hypothetical protein